MNFGEVRDAMDDMAARIAILQAIVVSSGAITEKELEDTVLLCKAEIDQQRAQEKDWDRAESALNSAKGKNQS